MLISTNLHIIVYRSTYCQNILHIMKYQNVYNHPMAIDKYAIHCFLQNDFWYEIKHADLEQISFCDLNNE